MEKIEQIIKDSSNQIKELLLGEVGKFKDFPKTMVGIRNLKHANKESCIVEGLFSSVDVRSKGIAVPKSGIVVYDADKFWMENYFVLMLPDGLYRFGESIFRSTEDGKPTGVSTGYPDWESKTEESFDYLVHGKKAFYKMKGFLLER